MFATLLLGACGRIAFDPVDGNATELTITPAITRTNVNTTTAFVATGGEPPYTFRIASGTGELDAASGRFLAPSVPGVSTVEVTDAVSATRIAEVSYGGDQIYVIGGYVNFAAIDDVWRTTDGAQWELVGRLPQRRGGGNLLVLEDRLWWLGGALVPDVNNFDEVWSSPDGITWTEGARLPTTGAARAAAVYRGRIWIAGGQLEGTSSFRDNVWSSADGESWRVEPPLPVPIHSADLLVHDDELWLIAGHEEAGQSASVRRRTPTGTWPLIGTVPVAGEYHATIERDGRMWVAGGLGLGNRVVTSVDGITWTDVAQLPIPREHARMVEVRDEVWVVAGIPPQTVHTTDGTSWSMAAPVPMMMTGVGAAAFTPP